MKTTPKKDKNEGNKYDKIIQENLLELIPALFRKVLGLKDFRIENLPKRKQQTTLEREPDFLKLVFDSKHPKGCIQHLEFEIKDNPKMAARMLEYLGMVYRRYEIPIQQSVLFLGNGKAKMNRKIEFGQLNFAFNVYNLTDFSYKDFINSEQPEEVLLSILANHEDIPSEEIIQMILGRLVKLRGDSYATRKFIRQLQVISKLRKLQSETFKQIDNMSISFDIKTDILWRKGQEAGLEKGKIIKNILAIRNMLKLKMEHSLIANIQNVNLPFIEKTQKELEKEDAVKQLLKGEKSEISKIAKKENVSEIFVEAMKEDLAEQS